MTNNEHPCRNPSPRSHLQKGKKRQMRNLWKSVNHPCVDILGTHGDYGTNLGFRKQ